MKKIKLLLTGLCLSCLQMQAQDWQSAIVIEKTDGTNMCICLADKPELEYGKSTIEVMSASLQTSLDRKLVRKCYFADKSVSIEEVAGGNDGKQGLVISYTDGRTVVISGEVSHVQVYAIDGRKVSAPCTTAGGKTMVSLDSLPQGTYVIEVNDGQSFKVRK